MLVGPACLPAFTANLVHQLSTTKIGATYPPINTKGTGQSKLTPSFLLLLWFCGSLGPFSMSTNGEAQTNQQSNYLEFMVFNHTKYPNFGPQLWLSGQRDCLLLQRSEFKSCWHLLFFSVKFAFEKNEKKQKEVSRVGPFLKYKIS